MPDTGKLYTLAQALGVTVDWLLSEDDPEREAGSVRGEYDAGTYVPGQGAAAAAGSAKSFWPAFKRWCWLAGVLVAVYGAYLIYQGAMAKLMVSKLMGLVNMGGALTETDLWIDELGMSLGDVLANNPVSLASTAYIVIGTVLVIAGIILAVVLKRKLAK